MKLSLLALAFSAATAIAVTPTLKEDWHSIEERAAKNPQKCMARLKRKYRKHTVQFSSRDLLGEDEDELDVELVERQVSAYSSDPKYHYRCGITGHVTMPAPGSQAPSPTTLQGCADYCICTQGRVACKAIAWQASNPAEGAKGTGTCQTYTKGYHHQGFQPGPDSSGNTVTVYNHHCYYAGQSQPTQTATPQAPKMHRRDAMEDYIVDALLGV